MMCPLVLGVYGFSDSGKTVLLCGLIEKCIADGLKVGVMKCSKEPGEFDRQGSDTSRYREAGASHVLFLSPSTMVFQSFEPCDEVLGVSLISMFFEVDVFLVEGSNHPDIQKIRIGIIDERKNTVMYCEEPNVEKVYEYVRKRMREEKNSVSKLKVMVNGKRVSLSDFPEDIILKTLVGMLSSLHGVDSIESFQIEYTK